MTEPLYIKRKYLSVSTLIDFARCPRRYFYRKSGLVAQGEFGAPLFGQAMHKALPVVLETGDDNLARAAFSSVWDDNLSDEKRNHETASRIIRHFNHTHQPPKSLYKLLPPPPGCLARDEKVSNYEIPWVMDVGLEIPLVGFIDGLVEHRDTKEFWGWELKTTGRLASNFFDSFEMNPQILTYSLVLSTLLGQPIKGMMVEGVLVSDKKVDNMIQPIPIQEHHLVDILQWLQRVGRQLLECEKNEDFPKDFTGCTAYPFFYFPSYRCEYADLCRVEDWRSVSGLFDHRPDHDFTEITIDGKTAIKPISPLV